MQRALFPISLILIALILLGYAFMYDQNMLFKLGGFMVLLAGIIVLLAQNTSLTKSSKIAITVFAALAAGLFSFLDYNSIQEPLAFEKVKKERFLKITQRLKDIREAQKAYKSVNRKYAVSFDSLNAFIAQGQVPVMKAVGNIPDGMTEQEAIDGGYYKKEVKMISAKSSIFNDKYMSTRDHSVSVDSLEYIPTTDQKKFRMTAGEVEKNNLKVKTLEVVAPNEEVFPEWSKNFYASFKDLKFGSTQDPGLNGNWE